MASMILALVMSFSALGCNLITVDNEKDMAQVVAVIQIEENVPKQENTIYKKDIVMAYMNYGYYYEQNGTSREEVIKMIVNSLINTRVYVQVAVSEFDKNEGVFANQIQNPSITDKWNPERYLTSDEIVEAKYQTEHDIDELIESYEVHDHGHSVGDTMTETVRTIPTGATNASSKEETPSIDQMKEFVIDTDSSDRRKDAYNDVIEVLKVNALLGDSYKGDIKDTDYYKRALKENQEQIIIEKYEKCITDSILAKYDFDDVRQLFSDKVAEQKKWTDADYSTALSSATASSPILYAPTGTYGYVYNLLLGIDDEQKEQLEKYDSENPNAETKDRNAARKEILDKTIVKDLRSTWVLSGYDFDGTKFTGDYTFTKPENSLPFFGETKHLNAGDEEHEHYAPEYGVISTQELSVSAFVEEMEKYLYGAKQDSNVKTYSDSSVYRAVNVTKNVSEYNEKINELLFAFSTDGGSLNTYKGYTISPIPDGSNQEQYMQEFADYGRKVLNGEVGTNGYIMVATDYGYHIMFYSEAYTGGVVYETLDAYLDGECAKYLGDFADWNAYFENMKDNWANFEDTDNYLYILYNQLVSNEISETISKYQVDLLNTYVYGENSKVTKYESRYADLMK